jgi:biotin operon repressor
MKKEIAAIISTFENQVNNSFPSIFSKQDVIELLKDLNNQIQSLEEPVQQLEITEQHIEEALDNLSMDGFVSIDKDTAEFELNYNNCIELTDVRFEVYNDELARDIKRELTDILNKGKN